MSTKRQLDNLKKGESKKYRSGDEAARNGKKGGIVSGGSYVGDSQIIRVNSGEAVLTQSDQSRFMRLLDGGSVSNSSNTYQSVEFKVRGSDLYGVLRNYTGIQSAAGHQKKI